MPLLTYPEPKLRQFVRDHVATLKQGRVIRRYHMVLIASVMFLVAIRFVGHEFTLGIILGRLFDAVGDVLMDRGFES